MWTIIISLNWKIRGFPQFQGTVLRVKDWCKTVILVSTEHVILKYHICNKDVPIPEVVHRVSFRYDYFD